MTDKLYHIGIRVSKETKAALEGAAADSLRSVSNYGEAAILWAIETGAVPAVPRPRRDESVAKKAAAPKDNRDMKIWRINFENIWKCYPEKKGKHAAWLSFKTQVWTVDAVININKALKNYIADMARVRESHPDRAWLHGSTWFNKRWEDYIDYKPPVGGQKKSTFQNKRDSVDNWAQKRGENGGKPISNGAQGVPELRGS